MNKKLEKEKIAAEKETAFTIDERKTEKVTASKGLFKTFLALWSRSFIIIAILITVIVIVLPIATFSYMKNATTFTEQKGVFLERVQSLNQFATAEAYTKVIIDQQDNEIFGKDIGWDVPGTKRQLLVVIPGSVRAGVDLSSLAKEDMYVNDSSKTIDLVIPHATFLGGAEIFFDKVEVYSYEGLFRDKANIEEAYDLANEAKRLIVQEATDQGVLEMAEKNAEQALIDLFSFSGYDVTINYKE